MPFEVRDEGGRSRVKIHGRWTVAEAASARADGAGIPSGRRDCVFDAAGIEALDLSGAWQLWRLEEACREGGAKVSWTPGRPELLEFIDRRTAEEDPPANAPSRTAGEPDATGALQDVGRAAVQAKERALDVLGFVGVVTTGFGRIAGSLKRLRLPSVVRHVYETGLTAVPIVSLIAFLIAVIVAYIGAQQLRKFGGEVFVVDLVTVSVLRELGVLLTAIIVAGRSGSAFAAEIGAMKLNDEVDALRAMGMDPIEVLVLPRILGLVIALPILTIVADAMGLAGGAILSWYLVDIPFGQYVDRVQGSISEFTFWVGIIKAPVFAALIAIVGTLRGMQVRTSSRELGRLTTVAVVQSIFLVILADAVFAVIFMELDI
jgi:phospholipid/cholesterol/gamma-HCH transport system permease protein